MAMMPAGRMINWSALASNIGVVTPPGQDPGSGHVASRALGGNALSGKWARTSREDVRDCNVSGRRECIAGHSRGSNQPGTRPMRTGWFRAASAGQGSQRGSAPSRVSWRSWRPSGPTTQIPADPPGSPDGTLTNRISWPLGENTGVRSDRSVPLVRTIGAAPSLARYATWSDSGAPSAARSAPSAPWPPVAIGPAPSNSRLAAPDGRTIHTPEVGCVAEVAATRKAWLLDDQLGTLVAVRLSRADVAMGLDRSMS